MLLCPWCKKRLTELARECPSCHADLSLLYDYVAGLSLGVLHAERMTREGRLAEAVWAYLDLLDVDPENVEARRQVGRVAAAVRHFDRRPRRRASGEEWGKGIWLVIVLAALLLGFTLGMQAERWRADNAATAAQKNGESE